MQTTPSVQIGELHVPGTAAVHGARTFVLTRPAATAAGELELAFGLFIADAPKRAVDKLCDLLIEEIRPVFFSTAGDLDARYEATLKQINRVILTFLHENGLSLPGIRLRGAFGTLISSGRDGKAKLLVSNRGPVRGTLIVPQHGAAAAAYPLFDDAGDRSTNPKFFSSFQAGEVGPGARLFMAASELYETLDEAFVTKCFTDADTSRGGRDLKNALRMAKLPASLLSVAIPSIASEEPAREVAAAPKAVPAPRPAAPALPSEALDVGDLASRALKGSLSAGGRAARGVASGTGVAVRGVWNGARAFFRLLADHPLGKISAVPDGAIARMNALAPRKRPAFVVSVIGVVILVHGGIAVAAHQLTIDAQKSYEAKLTEEQQLETDMETSLIYGNQDRARQVFAHMEADVASLPDKTDQQKKNKARLTASLEDARGRLNHVFDIASPDVFAKLDGVPGEFLNGRLSWFAGALYIFSPTAPEAVTIGADGTVGPAAKIPGMTAGIADAAPGNTGFLLLQLDGRVAYWNPAKNDAVQFLADGVGTGPILLSQGRLYHPAGSDGLVRQAVTSSRLGPQVQALPADATPASLVGMAADASLYTLADDGSIKKFYRGAAASDFQRPLIDPAPRAVSSLATSTESPYLTFIERGGSRVFVVDKKNGSLVSQITSPAFNALSGLALDPSGGAAYVMTGAKILKVPLGPPPTN